MVEFCEEYFLESPKGRCMEGHVKNMFPDIYSNILGIPGNKFSEKLYRYFHPDSGTCVVCGNPTKFRSFTKGFFECCCSECAMANPARTTKIKNTTTERYGVGNVSKLDDVKEKKKVTLKNNHGVTSSFQLEQCKNTILNRYGVDNVSKLDDIKEKKKVTLINHYGTYEDAKSAMYSASSNTKLEHHGDPTYNNRKKAANTVRDRYGVDNVFQSDDIKEKIKGSITEHYGSYHNAWVEIMKATKKTKQDRYGDPYYNNRARAAQTSIEKYGVDNYMVAKAKENNPDLISSSGGVWVCECPHPGCDRCLEKCYKTWSQLHYGRKNAGQELCTVLNPVGSKESQAEIEVRRFIDTLGISYETNTRDIISPQELDIYIPSKQIAIEFNGCYWHSDREKNKNYHINKYKACRDKGIQLIQIWEDWWVTKKDIIKSIISSKLGVYKERMYARKCEIHEVSAQEARGFEQRNHIQGSSRSKYRYGLYCDGKLLSLMTFGKTRICMNSKSDNDSYELIRFCCEPGYQIIGGASRLIAHFIRTHKPKKIISFSSNDISNGSIYQILGFKHVGESISYWYIDQDFNRYHRYTFNKSQLIKKGLASDNALTERQIMDENGFLRIFDSGVTKWEMYC